MIDKTSPLIDPVSGFAYPDHWVGACASPDDLELVKRGLSVLMADGKVRKRGFTTGTTAAAACSAAVLSLAKEISCVRVLIPCGLRVDVIASGAGGVGSCRKYAGDYLMDVTAGLEIKAAARPLPQGLILEPGKGIGRFSRATPRYPEGTPAISPPALSSIMTAVEEAMAETGLPGVGIHLSVPKGEMVSQRTLNPKLGILGGISILGTTGLVEPWDDNLAESVIERAATSDRIVLTTGRIGLRYSRLIFPEYEVILAGGKFDAALFHAKGEVILCGLPGLILNRIDPSFLEGSGYSTIEEFTTSPLFTSRMMTAIMMFKKRYPAIRVVLINRQGIVIGDTG